MNENLEKVLERWIQYLIDGEIKGTLLLSREDCHLLSGLLVEIRKEHEKKERYNMDYMDLPLRLEESYNNKTDMILTFKEAETISELLKELKEYRYSKNSENRLLEEAIFHAKAIAEDKCNKCGEEHRQLAVWLEELKQIREILLKKN